ncbi:hypothetical protein, conserved [Babesia ovata]|uniref:Extracellular matrix-binding ebh n=1 Tax=Babesia ovata TaxID=189622 RepID=A0A2H6K7F5_9APIC|nr:uncharacterized protein BOVATA_003820 [Babesia ovata]GBE58889.1 hypothetical protein, conserved [Babesia ovata]
MAPKALTDCPENLREAIDWLIQVKQGGGISTLCQALGELFDNVVQDAKKHLSSLSESDDPSAGDVISKLQGFRSSLSKDSANNNQNILHNLCSSFETFLGYKPPGIYDGSGIVYGSASRLCDAIIEFLHSALSDVYENQPYVAGRAALSGVVGELGKARWRGHHGFKTAVPKVAGGLGEYNKKVKASNEKVRKPIDDVIAFVKDGGELRNGIDTLQVSETSTPTEDEKAVEAAASLVEKCKTYAANFSKKLTSAESAIGDLNPKLRSKLENARKSFFNHVGWLSKWSRKGQKKKLDEMIHKIKTRLRRLGKEVKDRIKQEVHALVELLKERVRKIKRKLEDIRESLAKYVQDLVKWMVDAKRYIDQVKKYVDKILEEIYGEHKTRIDEAAGEIDATLSKKVAELNKWIEAADAAVKAARQKAEDVYGRLDHTKKDQHGGTTIGQNIENIKQAKDKVQSVDDQLKSIHADLGNWKDAASGVLGTAVGKAQTVHGKLDPDKSKSTLGGKIGEIEDAKNNIISANSQLKSQVDSLNSWIGTAEDIRKKAQQKAEEAYSKLDVHAELSKNVEKIVDANKALENVNKNLTSVHGSLGEWKEQARSVLEGAIQKATEVHDALKDGSQQVGKKITKIENDNKLIIEANKTLAAEVGNLKSWKNVAEKVIMKANEKCEEILKRVKTEDSAKEAVIYKQAQILKEKGTELYNAAKSAKDAVEKNVKDALQAVVRMDKSLKTDLKKVRDDLKDAIWNKIVEFKVNKLDDLVKRDLEKLRKNILGLGQQVDKPNGDSLVNGQLTQLQSAKEALEQITHNGDSSIKKLTDGLDEKFRTHIQDELDTKVKAVDSAIGELGEKFNGISGDPQKLQSIFEHIKGEVEKIKGTPGGKDWKNTGGKGLDGISSKVESYFEAFGGGNNGNSFRYTIVKGWLDDMLPHNGVVKRILTALGWNEKRGEFEKTAFNVKHSLTEKIRETAPLKEKIQKGVDVFKGQQPAGIQEKITKVKEACQKFADALDGKLKEPGNEIVSKVKNVSRLYKSGGASKCICECGNCNKPNCAKKAAAELILCALTAVARQVGNELNSVFLNIPDDSSSPSDGSIAKILDHITPIANDLYTKLDKATKPGQPPTPEAGTAQAVDSKLQVVREFVNGKNGNDITSKFKNEVTNGLKAEVDKLPGAVTQFNSAAVDQIKKAAETAIEKAAEQISKGGDASQIDLSDKMNSFHTAHDKIVKELETELGKKVNQHIGEDDGTGGKGGTISKLAGNSFEQYKLHVTQDKGKLSSLTGEQGKNEGHLPQAIGNIRTLGLAELSIIEPVTGGKAAEITQQTFTVPFGKIKNQLEEIKKLVEKNDPNGVPPFLHADPEKGVKPLLKHLTYMLGNGRQLWDNGAGKGLEAIKTTIQNLHNNQFKNQPTAIEKAVQEIKAELKKLREKLKKEKGGPNDGVIDSLEDLKQHGLAQSAWNGKNVKGQTLSGLGKIHGDLQGQNTELGKQNKAIGEAIRDIRWQLLYLGFKVQNIFNDDDILDNLRRLKGRIGMKQNIGLEAIKNTIQQLQQKSFQQHPKTIGDAKQQIVDELGKLQGELQGSTPGSDVITTLNDLQNKGLGKNSWNKEKGLAKINSELQGQQQTLGQQPENIGGGVRDITLSLNSLRDTLNEQVTEKLKKLKDSGVNDGSEKWNDNGFNKGLTKITTGIVAIKTTDVKDVKEKLKELCTAIKNSARDAAFTLKEVKEKMLDDELTGIKDQLHNLQIRLERGPIQACREFIDRDADKFGRECIASLTAFVDGQVDTAIDDLTAFAKQQYVSNIKEALKAFASKVEEELTPLPPLITEDLQIGYKGFVKQVEGGKGVNINRLKDVKSRELQALSSAFAHFFGPLNEHLRKEIERLKKHGDDEKNPLLPKSQDPYVPLLDAVHSDLNSLLNYLCETQGYDHRLQALLRSLTDALSHLKPESFARPSSPLLDGLVEGLTKFAAEFRNCYISAYSGAQFTAALVKHETLTEPVRSQGTNSVTVRNVSSLTPYGAMCAKVFLTLMPTLCDAFNRLAERCGKNGKWRNMNINSSSKLGTFLQRCGYKVSTSATLQDGELRDDCNGCDVFVLVTQNIRNTEDNEHLKECLSVQHGCNLLELLKCLSTHLHEYYKTCHLRVCPSPRPPCSIYEMLTWCCGLPHNAVYLGLNSDTLPSLFEADEQDFTDSEVSLTDLSSLALKAHPEDITPASLTDALTEVCHRSHSVLTTLLGYGHAGGIYAVDFNTNPGGLLYPGDVEALLCLLYDVLKRLHHQLYLLYRRCLYNARHGGWLDCWYGRGVGGSAWRCNTMQCANQQCPHEASQTGNQICNQICNQNCDQHPKCGVKSPLQSFLEDGLQGFLPHQLSPDGTCVKCSGCDTKSPGMPCKTPMGLSNITRLASRASTGRHIMDVLGAFCGGASSPLTRLCGYLECLLTRPPRTPDELFAFFFNFISEWSGGGEHRKAAFEDAVGDACFRQRGVTLDIAPLFRTSDHGSEQNVPHLTGDLSSLVKCNGSPGSSPSHPCGPYLKPLGHDVRATFAKEHAHLYLSWVVYLTETFYDFLRELLQDCERNCADASATCHDNSCANDCTAKQRPMAPSSEHLDSCPSIVDCDSTTPTLFRYGFALRDAHSLAGSTSGHQGKRTCQDLCTALQVVVKQMNPLHKLAHDTIPEFLYRIRAPFLYTTVTLWLTATLYILVIRLYRMDVLRIRSHLLTTRASHLIDVKALLAGSRRMLSLYKDVDYFDDDTVDQLNASRCD